MKTGDDYKLDALIAVRMLASLEVSPRWRTAVEMLDDVIERATAESAVQQFKRIV